MKEKNGEVAAVDEDEESEDEANEGEFCDETGKCTE